MSYDTDAEGQDPSGDFFQARTLLVTLHLASLNTTRPDTFIPAVITRATMYHSTTVTIPVTGIHRIIHAQYADLAEFILLIIAKLGTQF